MKLGLNGWSTARWPIESDLEAVSKIGSRWLEMQWPKTAEYLKTRTLSELAALFEKYGIRPATITSIEEITFRDAAGEKELHKLYKRMCKVCAAVGSPFVLVVPSRRTPGLTHQMILNETADVVNKLADIGAPYNVGVAFEYVGCSEYTINNLEDYMEMAEKADRKELGVVVDTFHIHNAGTPISSLSRIRAEDIAVVHISDGDDIPVADLTADKYRHLPGDGVIPIKDMLTAVDKTGYDGPACFETLRPEHWEMDPLTLAMALKEKILAVYPAIQL
ncbi:MAG: sugar phosphate isomerase/epimerase [Armatimonadetes bacterium]|nr:sugar phosphate isomerase/epimerase [Armatimonadota bacterium]